MDLLRIGIAQHLIDGTWCVITGFRDEVHFHEPEFASQDEALERAQWLKDVFMKTWGEGTIDVSFN